MDSREPLDLGENNVSLKVRSASAGSLVSEYQVRGTGSERDEVGFMIRVPVVESETPVTGLGHCVKSERTSWVILDQLSQFYAHNFEYAGGVSP